MNISPELLGVTILIPMVIAIFKPLIPKKGLKRIPAIAVLIALGFVLIKGGFTLFDAIVQSLLIGTSAVGGRELTKVLHKDTEDEMEKLLENSLGHADPTHS